MKADNDLYRQLRDLTLAQLRETEVPRFEAAEPRERLARVAVVRAVGSAAGRFGTAGEKEEVRLWLTALLRDPQEKIRRYAVNALPKLGAGRAVEAALLEFLGRAENDREKACIARALEAVGGRATLESGLALPAMAEQKVRAAVERSSRPGRIRLDAVCADFRGLRVQLRCRRGLEGFVRDEAEVELVKPGLFRVLETRAGRVTLQPLQPFRLADLYRLRCFATVGFTLGTYRGSSEELARLIASPETLRLMSTFTEGSLRYRLEFTGRGHQRGAVRETAERAYQLRPEILNDSHLATWSLDVLPPDPAESVELRPRLHPDPRLPWRQDDVDAASHPPLAASLARLAGLGRGEEVVWDPFCGSGLELIERTLRGGVSAVHGTDLDPRAIEVARENFAAAIPGGVSASFTVCDFRDADTRAGIPAGGISLMITNPPLGRRVRIPDLHGLFDDLFYTASVALRPGGRLVLANPLRVRPRDPSLVLEFQVAVDMGGFECRIEKYRKTDPEAAGPAAGRGAISRARPAPAPRADGSAAPPPPRATPPPRRG